MVQAECSGKGDSGTLLRLLVKAGIIPSTPVKSLTIVYRI
ncbi:hypothetical protein ASZ90_018394 [hydrocarbon metagenome]|uniref:Uncharacterized protein n=1 Tax=hydrocarbon metagenome TaxID=938273 RepID=A0A0W8E6A5_9ZZZZ